MSASQADRKSVLAEFTMPASHPRACSIGAAGHSPGRAGAPCDVKLPTNSYEAANLGMMHRAGRGMKKDSTRAAELFKEACALSHDVGCLNLGIAYYNGDGVAKDPAQALAAFKKACEAANMDEVQAQALVGGFDQYLDAPGGAQAAAQDRVVFGQVEGAGVGTGFASWESLVGARQAPAARQGLFPSWLSSGRSPA